MESIEREKGERYEINFISKLKKFAFKIIKYMKFLKVIFNYKINFNI